MSDKKQNAIIEINGTIKENITAKDARELSDLLKRLEFKGYGFIATGSAVKISKPELRLRAIIKTANKK